MLDKILPPFFKRLRRRTRLSRDQFAARAGLSANTLRNYESGHTRPELKSEAKLLAAAACSDLDLIEMLCEVMSEEIDMRVGILEDEGSYRPGTTLARAEETRRRFGDQLTAAELRTLHDKVHTAQLVRMVVERHNADLDQYVAECRAQARRRRAAATHQGATGPATGGSSDGAGTVSHSAGAPRGPAITSEGLK